MHQKWVSFVAVLAMLFGTMAVVPANSQVVYAAESIVCAETYIVQANDWLSKIADRYFDDILLYQAIVNATNQKHGEDNTFANIDNADVIEPGWKLCIVDATVATDVAAGNMEGAMATDDEAMMADDSHSNDDVHAAPHWGYEGVDGPEMWGALDASFEACATGVKQSPINLTSATDHDLADIAFNYQPSQLNILNNGHTIQVNYDAGSSITVNGMDYNLLQFHYHTPSEHTIDGQFAPLEMHLVHANEAGELAVVGIMLTEGAENAALATVWASAPAVETPAETINTSINALDFLPAEQLTYRYNGSLTTPPCSEGVSWFVMTNPTDISADQAAIFKTLFEFNNRPVQPLNERELAVDNS